MENLLGRTYLWLTAVMLAVRIVRNHQEVLLPVTFVPRRERDLQIPHDQPSCSSCVRIFCVPCQCAASTAVVSTPLRPHHGKSRSQSPGDSAWIASRCPGPWHHRSASEREYPATTHGAGIEAFGRTGNRAHSTARRSAGQEFRQLPQMADSRYLRDELWCRAFGYRAGFGVARRQRLAGGKRLAQRPVHY